MSMLRELFQTRSPGGANELKLAVKAKWPWYERWSYNKAIFDLKEIK